MSSPARSSTASYSAARANGNRSELVNARLAKTGGSSRSSFVIAHKVSGGRLANGESDMVMRTKVDFDGSAVDEKPAEFMCLGNCDTNSSGGGIC